jgi:hypothetical protein
MALTVLTQTLVSKLSALRAMSLTTASLPSEVTDWCDPKSSEEPLTTSGYSLVYNYLLHYNTGSKSTYGSSDFFLNHKMSTQVLSSQLPDFAKPFLYRSSSLP